MFNLPQELVDMIIDEVVKCPPLSGPEISNYSMVSRHWRERTHKHRFRYITFRGWDEMEKWCTAIEAGPSGVSWHVRQLDLEKIYTLKGFEEHIRALTRVQEVELTDCSILRSLPDVETFTLMGSRLVRLRIDGALTTPHIMASLLAGLPLLRELSMEDLEFKCEPKPAESLPNIPFFEHPNSLELLMWDYLPEKLSWIPRTARFRDLRIKAICIKKNPKLVNGWLDSSGGSLQWLTIREDSWGFSFPPLDLSKCTAVNYLQFPVPLGRPEYYAEAVLPSLSSSRLSKVVLLLQRSTAPGIDFKSREIDPKDWENLERELCRLAKRFKAAYDGRVMKVMISSSEWYADQAFERLRNEWPMPNLEKEANIVFTRNYANPWPLSLM